MPVLAPRGSDPVYYLGRVCNLLEPAGMARKKPSREPVSYDRLIKVALQRYYPDLAAWLLGEKPVKSLSQKSSVGPRPSERPGGKERERGDLDGVDR